MIFIKLLRKILKQTKDIVDQPLFSSSASLILLIISSR